MNEESGRVARRRLPGIGQIVSESVGDLGGVLRLVPDIANYLRAISFHTKHMDVEVTGMHAAVERLDVELRELRAEIAELDARMGTVADAVERLEPHIADVNMAMRPFRRARAKLPGRPHDDGGPLHESASG
jgi:hypothetical protein